MQQQLNYYPMQDELDEELTIDLKKIFFALWSRKLLIISVFICVLVFFILLTFILPKKYKVDADLYINKSNNSNMAELNPYVISELGAGGGMAAIMSGGGTLANDIELMQSPLVIDKVYGFRFSCSSCSSTVIVANGRANMRDKPISSPDTTLYPNVPFSIRSNAALIFFNRLLSRSDMRRFMVISCSNVALSDSSPTPAESAWSAVRTAFNADLESCNNSAFCAFNK